MPATSVPNTDSPNVPLQMPLVTRTEEHFDSLSTLDTFLPFTADEQNRTVNVVWYTGAHVDRTNRKTGEPYKLRLDMSAAKLDRLNHGAPVFDNHMSGSDMSSVKAGTTGTKAQIGVVRKAWAAGPKGMATLQFANPDDTWSKVKNGIIQNLSFGAWINAMQPDETVGPNGFSNTDADGEPIGLQSFVATDWEPFEISPVCVPADFSTCFLSAETQQTIPPAPQQPAPSPRAQAQKEPVMNEQNTQAAGAESGIVSTTTAESTQGALALNALPPNMTFNFNQPVSPAPAAPAAIPQNFTAPIAPPASAPIPEPVKLAAEPVDLTAIRAQVRKEEQERSAAIRLAARPFAQLEESFLSSLIEEGHTLEFSRTRILEKLAEVVDKTPIRGENASVVRDRNDSRRENMEAALLVRYDSNVFADYKAKGREYIGCTLIDMAKECLDAAGVQTKGMPKQDIARLAIQGRFTEGDYFLHSAGSTSDFPNILANVANKSLRKAYEAQVSTFKPFSRQVTATDFKPLNRVQLSDIAALPPINEDGEYNHTLPTESKEVLQLATYGEIVAITRKVVINDDMNAFTRIPQLLGVAAATLESNKAWAVFTSNAVMSDGNALFSTAHGNLNTGAGSALGTTGLASAKSSMRLATAPKGTILNLTPRFIIVPAALEFLADQLMSPINIASSDFTKVVPQWIRSLQVIVEPRLDANSTTAWYLVADPAMIDTIEYCYLQGQEGIYTETRQGFNVDGVEVKARLDFGVAPVEYRGMQKNAGV